MLHAFKSAYFLLQNIEDDVTITCYREIAISKTQQQLIFRTAQLFYVNYMKTSFANVPLNKSPGLPVYLFIVTMKIKLCLKQSFETQFLETLFGRFWHKK